MIYVTLRVLAQVNCHGLRQNVHKFLADKDIEAIASNIDEDDIIFQFPYPVADLDWVWDKSFSAFIHEQIKLFDCSIKAYVYTNDLEYMQVIRVDCDEAQIDEAFYLSCHNY